MESFQKTGLCNSNTFELLILLILNSINILFNHIQSTTVIRSLITNNKKGNGDHVNNTEFDLHPIL